MPFIAALSLTSQTKKEIEVLRRCPPGLFHLLKGYTTANEPHYNDGYFGVKSNLASSDHGKVEENLAIYVVATFLAIIIKSRWAT